MKKTHLNVKYRPHILFIVNTTGAFISHRLPIARSAIRKGYKVSLASGDTNCSKEIEAEGIEQYYIPLNRSGTALYQECRLVIALLKLLTSLNPDLIHNVTMKPVLYAGLLNRFIGKKSCVNAITGLGYLFTRDGLKASIIQRAMLYFYYLSLRGKYSHTIFQNSDDLRLFVSKKIIALDKTSLMKGAGVSLDMYTRRTTPRIADKIHILFPARLLKDKGIVELVDAAKTLGSKYPVKFILAGGLDKVNPSAVNQSQLDEWQQLPFIDCIGHQTDMVSLYQKSDIVCLPSYREGMPRALLEAQACGCPVVTTDVPGCREAIIDGKSGLLVEKGSSEALSSALERLIVDKTLRDKMGRAARHFAEVTFSIDYVVDRTLVLYSELLAQKVEDRKKRECKGDAH